jgi:exopolysaccharide production protein ExoQ
MGLSLLFIYSLWLLWLLHHDGRERASVSSSIWIVLAWALIHGTRPVTSWIAGVDPSIFTAGSRDEGNPVEALVNLFLIIAGLIVLWRRGTRLSVAVKDNAWLFVLYLFWLLSIGWSDYPLITFKRLFKDLGTIVMVLVVLTELKPAEAIRAVCTRVAYMSIPLSILLYRYYPGWGRTFVGYKGDTQSYVGVTESKNTLGVLACVSALFLLWDLLELRGKKQSVSGRGVFFSRVLVLLMCWYLLLAINSATSLICAVIGSGLFIAFGLSFIKRNPGRVEVFGWSAAAGVWLLDSLFNIKEMILQSLGRDTTLTSRTNIWAVLTDYQDNSLGGAGFDTFWAGERIKLLADKTFGIIQAHNGYIETYLNGGFIGTTLLVVLLISAYLRIRKGLVLGRSEDNARFVLLLIALMYNVTEASFNKPGTMWFVTVYAIMEYRAQLPTRQASRSEDDGSFEESDTHQAPLSWNYPHAGSAK